MGIFVRSIMDKLVMSVHLVAFCRVRPQVQTARGRVYSLQAKSSGDANMWIRACRQHTAKETENQIMDKAERMILEVCLIYFPLSFPGGFVTNEVTVEFNVPLRRQAEMRSATLVMEHARKIRQEREQARLLEKGQRRR